jgi:autotransporter-associated beta strand protein
VGTLPNVTLNATTTFEIDNAAAITSITGAVTGAGGVTKTGNGTLIFSGTNSYIGGTTISGGTLQIGSGGTTGSITGDVTDNGVLAFNRSDSVTFAGVISGGGSVSQIGSGTTILTGTNTYNGGTTISSGTLQIGNGGTAGSIIGDVTDNGVLAFNRSDSVTFSGVISGTGSVSQIGTGTTILTGVNNYNGGTTISSGTLQIGNGGLTGGITGDVTDNGVLAFDRGDSATFSGMISGTGSISQIGTGTTILTNTNNYGGGTNINAGTLQLGVTNALPTGTTLAVAGTLELAGFNQQVSSVTGTGTVTNSSGTPATFTVNNAASDNFAGTFTGANLSLTKSGAGTLALTGAASSYGGATTINAGTLQLAPVNQTFGGPLTLAGSTAVLSLSSQAGLNGQYYNNMPDSNNYTSLSALQTHLATLTPALSANSTLAGANFDFGNAGQNFPPPYNAGASNLEVEWKGQFNAQAPGLYTFFTASDDGSVLFIDGNMVVNNNFTQGVTERSGTIDLTAGLHDIAIGYYQGGGGYGLDASYTAPGGAKTLLPNSLLSSTGAATFGSLSGVAGSQIQLNGGQLTANQDIDGTFAGTIVDGSITGGTFVKGGAATLTLTGANTFTGGATVSAGTLQIGDGATAGATLGSGTVSTASGATLALNLLNGESFINAVTNDGHIVTNATLASNNYTLSGDISGTGDFTKNGGNTVTLTGNNTFTGGTAINGGLLQIGNGGTSGTLAGGVTNNTALDFNRGDDSTFAGNISGGGTVTKDGAGTLTFSGTNTYGGVTTINAGTLLMQAPVGSTSQSLSGAVNLAGATAKLALAGQAGLNGVYYSTVPDQNNFVSLSALQTHLATLTPR